MYIIPKSCMSYLHLPHLIQRGAQVARDRERYAKITNQFSGSASRPVLTRYAARALADL